MRVVLFGATGMVGSAVLRECMRSAAVTRVVSIGRTAPAVADAKFTHVVCADMMAPETCAVDFRDIDACFFCLGVSSVGKSQAEYTRLTYDLTIAWAERIARANPSMRLLYVSGMGTGGKAMWAQVKGRTEDKLRALLPRAVMIRLGAMQPMHGERPKTLGGAFCLRWGHRCGPSRRPCGHRGLSPPKN